MSNKEYLDELHYLKLAIETDLDNIRERIWQTEQTLVRMVDTIEDKILKEERKMLDEMYQEHVKQMKLEVK